jgi:prophage regulatory protein
MHKWPFFILKTGVIKMERFTIDVYLSDKEICKALGKSRPTLWRWRREGKFPLPHRLGENSNGTPLSIFQKWQEEKAKNIEVK